MRAASGRKPNWGPPVVSISTTRATPMTSGFSHGALALDASGLSVVGIEVVESSKSGQGVMTFGG